MNNLIVNIRFGSYHFQISRDCEVGFKQNDFHIGNPTGKWFAVYDFPGLNRWLKD